MTDMTGYRDSDLTCDAFAERLADYLEGECSGASRELVEAHAAACGSCGALLADLVLLPQAAAALPPLVPSRDLWTGIAERIDARVLPLDGARTTTIAPSWRRGWVRPAVAAAALILFTASVTHVLTRASYQTAGSGAATTPSPRQVASATPAPAAVDGAFSSTATESDAVASHERDAATSRDAASEASPSRERGARASGTPRVGERPAGVRLASRSPLQEAEPVYDREIAKLRRIVRDRHSQLDPATIAVLEQSVAVIDSAIAQSRAALARDPASGFLANQLNHSLEKKVELLRTAALLPPRT